MNTPAEIIDAIGSEAIAAKIGVAESRVRRARNESRIPASWWRGMSDLAGEDLPSDAFTFKMVNADVQDGAA